MTRCKNSLLFLFVALMTFGTAKSFARDQDNDHVQYINQIKGGGITISESGVYRFLQDMDVDLDDDGITAITITADNVVLDLNQYTLSQSSETNDNAGIVIDSEVSFVTIKNGTIEGFSSFGIIVSQECAGTLLTDLVVTNCGWNGGIELPDTNDHAGGILFAGFEAPIWDSTIQNCRVQWNGGESIDTAFDGLAVVGALKMKIQNSCFSDNWVGSDISVAGAEFFWCDDVIIENCRFDDMNLETDGPVNAAAFGILFNGAFFDEDNDDPQNTNIKIYNSTANDNGGTCQEAAGFSFYRVRNLVIENCESHQTWNDLNDATGDLLYTAAAGFLFDTCDNFFVNECVSYNHGTKYSTQRVVGGFDIAASNFGVISNSHAAYCYNQGGSGILAGFVVEPTITRDDFFRSTGIVFENCISEYNLGDTGLSSVLGGGFFLSKVDSGKIIDCEAIFNRPCGIVVGLENGSNNDTINSIIKDNIVFSNAVAGIIDITGNDFVEGDRTGFVNAYLGNLARSNGNDPQTDNYGLPDGNSVVGWFLSNGSTSGASEETDNISIY